MVWGPDMCRQYVRARPAPMPGHAACLDLAAAPQLAARCLPAAEAWGPSVEPRWPVPGLGRRQSMGVTDANLHMRDSLLCPLLLDAAAVLVAGVGRGPLVGYRMSTCPVCTSTGARC